jgi:hypothetical protein
LEKFNSYDDFICFNLKISRVEILLEKSNDTTPGTSSNLAKEDDIWEVVYFKNNKLDNKVGNDINFEFNNKLLKIEFRQIELNLFSNFKENLLIEFSFESLNVTDIGYKTIMSDTIRNEKKDADKPITALPLVNIQYKFTLLFESIVNNRLNQDNEVTLNIDVPKVFLCLDPITIYMTSN